MQVLNVYTNCRKNTEYGFVPNGILPVSGGVLDQSKTMMDAFAILDRTILEARKKD